jgi:hypothetical protein
MAVLGYSPTLERGRREVRLIPEPRLRKSLVRFLGDLVGYLSTSSRSRSALFMTGFDPTRLFNNL